MRFKFECHSSWFSKLKWFKITKFHQELSMYDQVHSNSIRNPSKSTMIHYTKSSYFITKLQGSYKRNIKIPKVFFLIFIISTIWSVYLHLKLPLYHYRNLFQNNNPISIYWHKLTWMSGVCRAANTGEEKWLNSCATM